MSDLTNPSKLAYSSRCLPGSIAEQKEQERLAEFHRLKALRKAEEERARPEAETQRREAFAAASKAYKEQMQKNRMPFFPRAGLDRP